MRVSYSSKILSPVNKQAVSLSPGVKSKKASNLSLGDKQSQHFLRRASNIGIFKS